ncbi:AGE family epimerase/isomerase [Demequina oxidasica]|uniref:AGE family epimerase/isomerase n=1 Tax=Demequina oxidasica TaxID=676199 RepID=UPI0007832174|nr:AGE family epimerase/isomerase [Demequina oxidasica]
MRPDQRARVRAEQRADLLRFTQAAKTDRGFGWLDERGNVLGGKPEELWITCRMTHIAALGVLANEEPKPAGPHQLELRALVSHGVRALSGAFEDQENGGWFAAVDASGPVDTAKQAYGHAFVVLAASSALLAGAEGARALLKRALRVSERRFWDDSHGLSVEEWDQDWTTLATYRGVNANMHTVEAYLAAGDATGDKVWHERAGRIAARVLSWSESNEWRIPEHFDEDWRPMLEHNRDIPADPFRPYGATVGHGLEWARLFLSVDATLDDKAPAGLAAGARKLYGRAVSDGWHADGDSGFVYTTDWDGRPVVRERMHWVAAEAIGAAHALAIATGEQRYTEDAEKWWGFVDDFLVDEEFGSWHHELNSSNRRAASVWPGKPDTYHAYQAALWPDVPLAPSFATALARGSSLSQDHASRAASKGEGTR